MKIRGKLFLGFSLYIFLASIFAFFSYRELAAISNRLRFLEMADDVTITMLEVRRYEKNFLLYKDRESMPLFRSNMRRVKALMDGAKGEISKEIGAGSFREMDNAVSEYERWFEKVAQNYEQQEKLVWQIRETGREVEKSLSGRKLDIFLVLRRHEKNLIIYKDQESAQTFTKTYRELGGGTTPAVSRYYGLVMSLYELYNNERSFDDKMRWQARKVQSITVELARKERLSISRTIQTAVELLLVSLLLIIVLGTIINTKLSSSIAGPIRKLQRLTGKIASGDFSETIDVQGKDEIASLGASFNQMEVKLRDALSSLERAIVVLEEKQSQLVEAEKLASIGLLVAGVAHEINNPLTSVLTFSNLMLENMPKDDPNRERLEMMAWETNRARTIVRQLLSFARENPMRPVKININEPVSEIMDSLMAQNIFTGIELKMDLAEGLPEVNADPAQVGQVVLNLVLNSVKAITPPGRIEVSTRAAGGFVELKVSDTGCGIPKENIGRIFEPFFTTRAEKEGSGLGLAVSYGIVKKHHGSIEVASEPGEGAAFTVRFPVNG